jgi:hypothetical protein
MEMPGKSQMLLVLLLGGESRKHPNLHIGTLASVTKTAAESDRNKAKEQ